MRPQKKLSKDLSDVERYIATESIIKPLELKKIFKRLIVKAEIQETQIKRNNYAKRRRNIREEPEKGKYTS